MCVCVSEQQQQQYCRLILDLHTDKRVDEKSKLVQKFYKATTANLEKLKTWSSNEIETLLDATEHFLVTKFYDSYQITSNNLLLGSS